MEIFILIFGLIIGSFLNVIIYRLPRDESIVYPPSHCPHCGTRLKAVDLVPVFTFLWNRGRCRYCSKPIDWYYPIVELLTGLLFLLLYLKFGNTINFWLLIILVSLLITISFIDLKYMIIPNKITYPGMVVGLIISLIYNHISFLSSLLGLLVPASLLLLLASIFEKGLGMGDVKLVAMIGTFIGWEYTLLGIFLGSLIGAVPGLVLIITGVIDRKTRIPFGPLISVGTIITILYGKEIIELYLNLYI